MVLRLPLLPAGILISKVYCTSWGEQIIVVFWVRVTFSVYCLRSWHSKLRTRHRQHPYPLQEDAVIGKEKSKKHVDMIDRYPIPCSRVNVPSVYNEGYIIVIGPFINSEFTRAFALRRYVFPSPCHSWISSQCYLGNRINMVLPRGVTLTKLRKRLLELGVHYCWLGVERLTDTNSIEWCSGGE